MSTPPMSPMVVGRKQSNLGTADHRRGSSWLSRLGRRLSISGTTGPTSAYQGRQRKGTGMSRNPAFFEKESGNSSSDSLVSENPMFGVRAPSFSSPKAAREDRRSIRKSRKQSHLPNQGHDMESIAIDAYNNVTKEQDEEDQLLQQLGTSFDEEETKSSRPRGHSKSGRNRSASKSSKSKSKSKSSRERSHSKSHHKERSSKSRNGRDRAESNSSRSGNKSSRRPAIDSYKRQSSEVDVVDWVVRMDAIMELRKKHRSFRKNVILERPGDEPSEEDMAIC